MNSIKKIARLVALSLAVVPAMAFSAPKNIVETAASIADFSTLVSLVKQADLAGALSGKGPFTVLAPSNKAFAKLPKAVVERITGDKELLKQVLTYHVIAGKVLSTDLKNGIAPKTLQGETVKVKIKGHTVTFNKSKVVKADVIATNGVIHVIDTVLVPPSVAALLAKPESLEANVGGKSSCGNCSGKKG